MADAAKPCWQELGSLGTVQHGYGRGVSKHKGEFSFGGGGKVFPGVNYIIFLT